MKRLVKNPVQASTQNIASEHMFTPADVLQLLSKVTELNGCKISLWDTTDAYIEIAIGESVYRLSHTLPGTKK